MREARTGKPAGKANSVTDRIFPIPPLARRVFDLMANHEYEVRIAGGAVRDWVASGRPESFDIVDLDMAVASPIVEAAAILRTAGLRVVDTGLSHGTVTIVEGEHRVELTQTRVDVETDGRHAVVAFSDDWKQDAARRDFTINALYIDSDGRLQDPLGGMADLQAGILRFVGDADQRVAEDALRMLRYCRFLPRFGRGVSGGSLGGQSGDNSAGSSQLDASQAALAALKHQAGSASNLSGERVADECRKMLSTEGAFHSVSVMQSTGLARAALGVELDADTIAALPVADLQAECGDLVWLVALAAGIPVGSSKHLVERLRLSRRESRFLTGLDVADSEQKHAQLTGSIWQRYAWFMLEKGLQPAAYYAVSAARSGVQFDLCVFQRLADWQPPNFPVTAADLLSHGVDKGPAVGETLARLQQMWVESDFTLERGDLLANFALSNPSTS